MKEIFEKLNKSKNFYDITCFDTLESTNTTLKEMARKGANEGTVLIAKEQTAGRGKMNRSFFSPNESGIYMSILLRPDLKPEEATFLTAIAAVSVCEAIEKVSDIKTSIKWVNDIYCKGKKLCGILTEAGFGLYSYKVGYCVVGIGVNLKVAQSGFPKDIEHIAGAVFDENDFSVDKKNRIISHILESFYCYYKEFEEKTFIAEYKNRSNLIGKEITITDALGSVCKALVLDIDDECTLVVKYEDGTEEKLISGDVSIKI